MLLQLHYKKKNIIHILLRLSTLRILYTFNTPFLIPLKLMEMFSLDSKGI